MHLHKFAEEPILVEGNVSQCLIKCYTMKMYGVQRDISMHS